METLLSGPIVRDEALTCVFEKEKTDNDAIICAVKNAPQNVFLPCVSYHYNGKRKLMYLTKGRKPIAQLEFLSEKNAVEMAEALLWAAEDIIEAESVPSDGISVSMEHIFWKPGEPRCSFIYDPLLPDADRNREQGEFEQKLAWLVHQFVSDWAVFADFRAYVIKRNVNVEFLGDMLNLLQQYSQTPAEARTDHDDEKGEIPVQREHEQPRHRKKGTRIIWPGDVRSTAGMDEEQSCSDTFRLPLKKEHRSGTVIDRKSGQTVEDTVVTKKRSRTIFGTQIIFQGGARGQKNGNPTPAQSSGYRLVGEGPKERIDISVPERGYLLGRCDKKADGVNTFYFSEYVARRHCKLYLKDGALYVKDLKSTNHTYINEMEVLPAHPMQLREGDTLRVADIELVLKRG